MQVVVDDLLIEYQQSGDGGDAILLLHGWGDSHKTFSDLQEHLAISHRVIGLDLPGFGHSQAPDVPWGLNDYAKFVNKFLYKIHVKKLHAIVGHSNGGALAICGVGEGILSADKLILIAASGIRNRQKGKRMVLKVVAKTGKTLTFWLPNIHKQKLRKRLYGAVGSDILVTPHLQETFKRTVRQDVQHQAKQIQIPTLLIYGDQDKDTPPLYGEIYHNLINGSTLEIIGGAGHFVHHDKPDNIVKLIEEFLG